MSLLTALPTVSAEHPLIFPAPVFPLIAIGGFLVLGFVAWSYRDVANRHAGKRGGSSNPPHGPSH